MLYIVLPSLSLHNVGEAGPEIYRRVPCQLEWNSRARLAERPVARQLQKWLWHQKEGLPIGWLTNNLSDGSSTAHLHCTAVMYCSFLLFWVISILVEMLEDSEVTLPTRHSVALDFTLLFCSVLLTTFDYKPEVEIDEPLWVALSCNIPCVLSPSTL